jgi:ketosteroid isomerase-like protein
VINIPKLSSLYAILVVSLSSTSVQSQDSAHSKEKRSLAVQGKSGYVTDRSRWGKLIFDPAQIKVRGGSAEDVSAIATLIEKYHRAWLSRDAVATATLLDADVVRFRGNSARFGSAAVLKRMARESRGERPEGYAGSTELALRDVQLSIDGDTATAFYRIDTHVGARWEFSDLLTVKQAFHQTDGRWTLFHHVESERLDDSNAPALPDREPNRRTPFVLDFAYPVKNLTRAIAFYAPFLGEPDMVTKERASFSLLDSHFELEAAPFDDRITIKHGAGNGYGIINVPDLDAVRAILETTGTKKTDVPKACGPDLCLIAEDPSKNIVVWRQHQAVVSSEAARPTLSFSDTTKERAPAELQRVLQAWMNADHVALVRHVTKDSVWVDDALTQPLGVAMGRDAIGDALVARWGMLDRGTDGLQADMSVTELRTRTFGAGQIVTFELALQRRGAHPVLEHSFVSQFWMPYAGESKIKSAFIARKFVDSDMPVSDLDYTAYPLLHMGEAGRFYRTVLGTEPYRDSNWFGFWSVNSVFGMLRSPKNTPFKPYPHRNNGYADFTMRSAEEVLGMLQKSGAELPHVPGINNRAGIDPNPGYRQVLAIDTEGNLINFSEYGEY